MGWVHQRSTIDNSAGMKGGEGGLRPTQNLYRRTIEKQLCGWRTPKHLIGNIVWPIDDCGDSLAGKIEGRIVAPIIAPSARAPIQKSRTHIHDLTLIINERIAGELVTFGAGGEVHADAAALKPIIKKSILVGVIDKHAFLAVANNVSFDNRVICIIEQQPIFAIGVRDIAVNRKTVRKHQHVADIVSFRNVIRDLAIIRIHKVYGKAKIMKAIAAHRVALAGDGKNTVTPGTDIVVKNLRAGSVPKRNGRPPFADAQFAQTLDAIVANQRIMRPVEVYRDQIFFQEIAFDLRTICGAIEKNAGIFVDQAKAGTANNNPAQGGIGRFNGNHAAFAVTGDDSIRRAFARHAFNGKPRHVNHRGARMKAGGKA